MEEPLAAKPNQTLRERFDGYRREMQRLQDEQEDREKISRLLRTLARRLLKEPWQKVTGKDRREVHGEDHLLRTESFKPYALRYRKPGAAGPRPVVVHLVGNFCVGGVARLVVDMIEWTSDSYEHVVLTLHNPNPPAYLGAQVFEIGPKTSLPAFANQIRRFNPVLIHVHHYAPHSLYQQWCWYRTALQAASGFGVPVIEGVNVPMTPYLHPCVRVYVHVSRYVRDNFGFSDCRNEVIYPGSDFSIFSPRPHPFSDTIGMVYRLDESKLRRESIEVFIRALQRRPSARALIVGDGCLLPYYKERARQAGLEGRFFFPGYVAYEDLPGYYNQMDVFVAPVFCESFGQVTPFAMNMGIPAVAYATGALPEMLADDSLTVSAGDVEGLVAVILRLLSDPGRWQAVAEQNRQRAQAVFSVEAMVEQYRRLYQELRTKPDGHS